MVATASTMLPLGTIAPGFSLPDSAGDAVVSLDDFAEAPALLVMFISNHCPYVKLVADELVRLARDYGSRGVAIVAICANDADKYPDDAPAAMAEFAAQHGFGFPYLHDESQSAAKAYRAACTPDLFLFDAHRRLVYRGQLDGARPGNDVPVDGRDLRAALHAVLAGEPIDERQVPSMGCNIKWKPGNQPDYFPPGG